MENKTKQSETMNSALKLVIENLGWEKTPVPQEVTANEIHWIIGSAKVSVVFYSGELEKSPEYYVASIQNKLEIKNFIFDTAAETAEWLCEIL